MDYITWGPEIQLGVPKIDEQHKRLVEIINELHRVVHKGVATRKISKVVDELIQYTEYHFRTEEDLLQKGGYIHLDEHIREHHNFVMKLNDYIQQDGHITRDSIINMLSFLKSWLTDHILISDKKYLDTEAIKLI